MEMQPTPVFLPGESQGRRSLLGCRLWGRRVWHDWSDLAAAAAEVVRKSCGGVYYMVILANFTDKGTFEQKYEGKRGEVVEFWIFFLTV